MRETVAWWSCSERDQRRVVALTMVATRVFVVTKGDDCSKLNTLNMLDKE
jgi:hypothetical protein